MGAAGQVPEHPAGLFFSPWLAQDLTVQTDYSVGRYQQFGICEGVGAGLQLADVLGNFCRVHLGGVGFVNSGDNPYLVGDS